MAEIKIEKRRTLWPWLVMGLVLLALIIYFFVYREDKNEDSEQQAVALITVRENNATVTDYVQFVNQDSARMTLDHSYTNEAILKLTNAVSAIANEIDFDVKADLDKVKEHADVITDDPYETSHADHIRKAADILATALQRMQQAKYPELSAEAEQLKESAAAINPEVLTLQQKDAVKEYFNRAAILLEKMN